ncbi:RICIN domain-containing protein [Erwinia typographi]|uniref:hypothetical protein n=1 Tax=Erwinia typographi TaxID=371042 RepID=UPI00068BC5D3|nr:hypothetical protein [Erwinia typographi]
MNNVITFRKAALSVVVSTCLLGASGLTSAYAGENLGSLKMASDNNLCLDLASNKLDVTFNTCNKSDSQEWYYDFVGNSGTNFFLKNKEKGSTWCLRAFKTSLIKMDSCQGAGYTASRTWQHQTLLNGNSLLRNKYIGDMGKVGHYLFNDNGQLSLDRKNLDEAPEWQTDAPLPEKKLTKAVGNKKIALLITHFDGKKPANSDVIKQAVFGDKNDFTSLRQHVSLSSRGKLTLSGDTFSDINLGPMPNHCDTPRLRALIAKKAAEKGIDLSKYDSVFTEMSANPKCTNAAIAALPGNFILSNGQGHKYWMWTHEFGHNLGFGHIDALKSCSASKNLVQIDGSCTRTSSNATDKTDTMGGGGGHLYPANYQYLLGWLDSDSVPLAGKTAARYTLAPLWQQTNGLQALRIARKDGSYLVLEYRQPQPGYEDWSKEDSVVRGVTVRSYKVNDKQQVSNTIIDMTPGSQSVAKDTLDAQLMPGKSFYDELSGRIISVETVNARGAVVTVSSSKFKD